MNNKYLNDNYMVHFKIQSDYGVNEEIMLPLELVLDLEEHMNAFDNVLKYPFKSVILNALCVYMAYLDCELIPFNEIIKSLLRNESERDMEQELLLVG